MSELEPLQEDERPLRGRTDPLEHRPSECPLERRGALLAQQELRYRPPELAQASRRERAEPVGDDPLGARAIERIRPSGAFHMLLSGARAKLGGLKALSHRREEPSGHYAQRVGREQVARTLAQCRQRRVRGFEEENDDKSYEPPRLIMS